MTTGRPAVVSTSCRKFWLAERRQTALRSWSYLVGLEWIKHREINERGSLDMVRLDVGTVQPASVDYAAHISRELSTVSTSTS